MINFHRSAWITLCLSALAVSAGAHAGAESVQIATVELNVTKQVELTHTLVAQKTEFSGGFKYLDTLATGTIRATDGAGHHYALRLTPDTTVTGPTTGGAFTNSFVVKGKQDPSHTIEAVLGSVNGFFTDAKADGWLLHDKASIPGGFLNPDYSSEWNYTIRSSKDQTPEPDIYKISIEAAHWIS